MIREDDDSYGIQMVVVQSVDNVVYDHHNFQHEAYDDILNNFLRN
jgi:hypothetical protein